MRLSTTIQHDIQAIREASAHNRLVLFVGAGVSANSGVPVWSELISKLKEPFSSPCDRNTDDLKAAQLYLDTYGRKDFLDIVRKTLKIDFVHTCDIHKLLLALKPQHIITTNYDTLIEDAVDEQLQKFSVIRTDSDIPYCSETNTIVKMHGDFVHGNIVLAEEDYLNYARNFPLIRTYVQSLFAKNLVLFVGFSFNDINLKFILQDIQSVLQQDMQRAYLLTTEEVSHASNLYYEHKGVHVVSITEKDLQTCNIDYLPDSNIKNKLGQLLCQQLSLINNYKEEKTLVRSIIDFLDSVDGQLIPHPDGLKYVVLDTERCIWNLHTTGIQLRSCESLQIKSLLKENNTATLLHLLRTYGKGLRTLGKYARANLLIEVDGVRLIKGSTNERDRIDLYYDFNMCELSQTIKNDHSTYKDTLNDLERPYILCLNGRYDEAYAEYKILASIYYHHRKYILYFLCLYNIVNMHSRLINQKLHKDNMFSEEIQKEIENIDLFSVLSKLPVSTNVRRILHDVISQKFQLDILTNILKYKNLLVDQRLSSEQGGTSINSHIALLDTCINRYLLFCHNNFLVCYDDALSRQIYTEYVQGLLESFATVENEVDGIHFRCSKITTIDKFHLMVMIFHMETEELKHCFNRSRVKQIEIDADSLLYFNRLIENIIENNKKRFVSPVAGGFRYWDVLKNTLFIYTHIKPEQQVGNVFPIVHYLFLNLPIIKSVPVYVLLTLHKPSVQESKELLTVNIERFRHFASGYGIIEPLTVILKNEGELIESIGSINQLPIDRMDIDDLTSCYHVLCPSVQVQLLEIIKQKIDSLPELLEIHSKHIPVLLPETFNKFMPPDFAKKTLYKHPREFTCSKLVEVRKDSKYEHLHPLIDDNFKDDICFRFFMDPLDCIQEESLEPQWILSQSDDIIKCYLASDIHRGKIKEYVMNDSSGHKWKDKILTLLLN